MRALSSVPRAFARASKVLLSLSVLASAPVAAQSVEPCDDVIGIVSITEPWEDYSRTYAEGAIRVFEAIINPLGAAPAVIGVLYPIPADPYPLRGCSVIFGPEPNDRYFGEALIAEATAAYDPARGLTIRVPVRFPDARQPIDAVEITVNQATGEVTAR